jgi:hypothetical protein
MAVRIPFSCNPLFFQRQIITATTLSSLRIHRRGFASATNTTATSDPESFAASDLTPLCLVTTQQAEFLDRVVSIHSSLKSAAHFTEHRHYRRQLSQFNISAFSAASKPSG